MKWFKHDANATLDAKLQRVRLKYGMEGYGLYWFCLESIARNVEAHNLTFELEEDAELISAQTNIHYERVQEMMIFMCDLGLFESADGQITCLKMATRTDEYTQKLLRTSLPVNTVRTVSGAGTHKIPPIRTEQINKKRKEKTLPAVQEVSEQEMLFDLFWNEYPKKTDKLAARTAWKKLKPSAEFTQTLITDCKNRVNQGEWCTGAGKSYIPGAGPYLNGRKWENEIIPRPEFKPEVDYSSLAANAQDLSESYL